MNKNSPPISIFLGYDSREATAFSVARYSIRKFNHYIPVYGLVLGELQRIGLYYRPTKRIEGRLWDEISQAHMSTEFAISRFLVPYLAGYSGWSLFADSDIMFMRNPSHLFDLYLNDKAVMVVKHNYEQTNGFKMDGQIQSIYPRKNWSSVMLFNCEHPANRVLTIEYVNTKTGRELHRFCWLPDELIGELPPEWNYCVGHSDLKGDKPALVHFTEGLPDMPGYEDQEYAEEWRAMRPHAVGAIYGGY